MGRRQYRAARKTPDAGAEGRTNESLSTLHGKTGWEEHLSARHGQRSPVRIPLASYASQGLAMRCPSPRALKIQVGVAPLSRSPLAELLSRRCARPPTCAWRAGPRSGAAEGVLRYDPSRVERQDAQECVFGGGQRSAFRRFRSPVPTRRSPIPEDSDHLGGERRSIGALGSGYGFEV